MVSTKDINPDMLGIGDATIMDVEGNCIKHSDVIDVVKGICILFVLILHYSFSMEERTAPILTLLLDMAVPVFIIVMGFNFSNSYAIKHCDSLGETYRNIGACQCVHEGRFR